MRKEDIPNLNEWSRGLSERFRVRTQTDPRQQGDPRPQELRSEIRNGVYVNRETGRIDWSMEIPDLLEGIGWLIFSAFIVGGLLLLFILPFFV